MQLTKKCGYFCDIQHFKIITRIMTDNVLSAHIQLLEILNNFWTLILMTFTCTIYPKKVYYHSFENAFHVI